MWHLDATRVLPFLGPLAGPSGTLMPLVFRLFWGLSSGLLAFCAARVWPFLARLTGPFGTLVPLDCLLSAAAAFAAGIA